MNEHKLILSVINIHFKDVVLAGDNMPCDYMVHTIGENDLLYVCVKENCPKMEETNALRDRLIAAIDNKICEQAPLVFLAIKDNKLNFGIMLYWENNRCIINKEVNWKTFTESNINWLNVQVHAQRMRINSLPIDYVRIVKKIKLNTKELTEGEIVYLRRLSEDYHMQSPKNEMTDEERFNRILNGTPQEEYPQDDLDVEIYENVHKIYPQATVTSHLLLFDVDLLNYRLYKEKKKQNIMLQWRDYNHRNIASIKLECYYVPNIFKNSSVQEKHIDLDVSGDQEKKIHQILETYNTFSWVNI